MHLVLESEHSDQLIRARRRAQWLAGVDDSSGLFAIGCRGSQ